MQPTLLYRRWLAEGLPPTVWVLQAGVFVNFLGNGLVAPFLVIYLHSARHIPLPVAGLALGSGAVLATTSGLVVGSLANRIGARNCLVGAMACNALAYAAYTQVHSSWQAVLVGAAVGLGTGAYGPSAQSLVASLVTPAQRQVALSQQRVTAVAGLGLGGAIGGLIAAAGTLDGYLRLLVLDVATFTAFAALLTALPNLRPPQLESHGGYSLVLRDRRLLVLAGVHLVAVSFGFAPMLGLFPVYAKGQAHIGTAAIGLLYALETAVILALQVPLARRLGTARPFQGLALANGIWVAAWTIVLVAPQFLQGAIAALALAPAMLLYAAGECMHSALTVPTAAGMAPDALRSRYLAVIGFAWQSGFLFGPALGGFLLGWQPFALPIVAAGGCAASAVALVVYAKAQELRQEAAP